MRRPKSKWYVYYNVEIAQGVKAKFKRNKIFPFIVYVFQANCATDGLNIWNEDGYGYGHWKRI